MLTQQDIYAAGSKNRPPMLNKDNYVPWSSRLLCYARSKPNGKLLVNSIIHGPYVIRMIFESGDPDHDTPIAESFHEQTDDELAKKKQSRLKLMIKNQFRQYVRKNAGNQIGYNARQFAGNQNGYNAMQNAGHQNANKNGNGNVVAARTERLRKSIELHLDSKPVASMDISMAPNGGEVEQHPATVEETRTYFESLYNNLVIEVEKVNMILKDEIAPIVNQVDARVINFEKQLLKEAAKFVRDFKSLTNEADESFDMNKVLEYKTERLLRAVDCKYDNISYDKVYNDMKLKIEELQAQLGDLKGKSINTQCELDTLDPLSQQLDDENMSLEFQVMSLEKENEHLKAIY
nr:Gag-Pol polyprotein [Tanacetum cinerariifolium]